MTESSVIPHHCGEAGVISAAEDLLVSLKAPLGLDETLQSLERFQVALNSNPHDREMWLAGGVYVGQLLRRMIPDASVRVIFEDNQPVSISLEGAQPKLIIPLIEWPPDPDRSLPFTFRGAQKRIRIQKALSGKRPFCLNCGHELTAEEVAEMEEFIPKHYRDRIGFRRACPGCGTAIYLTRKKRPSERNQDA